VPRINLNDQHYGRHSISGAPLVKVFQLRCGRFAATSEFGSHHMERQLRVVLVVALVVALAYINVFRDEVAGRLVLDPLVVGGAV
jgi:hypothetical protein